MRFTGPTRTFLPTPPPTPPPTFPLVLGGVCSPTYRGIPPHLTFNMASCSHHPEKVAVVVPVVVVEVVLAVFVVVVDLVVTLEHSRITKAPKRNKNCQTRVGALTGMKGFALCSYLFLLITLRILFTRQKLPSHHLRG